MNLLTAENAIKTRLEDQIKGTLTSDFAAPIVETFPQDFLANFESINPTGEILVRFDNALPERPDANRENIIVQNMAITWVIGIIMPNLREHTGIYNWIDKIKDALTGWTVTGWNDSTPMYCTSINFIDEKGGFWFYEMGFEHILEESEA